MSALGEIMAALKAYAARPPGKRGPIPLRSRREAWAVIDDNDRLLTSAVPEEELVRHPYFGEGAELLNNADLALRYEVEGVPRWDDYRHYDIAGGPQARDIAITAPDSMDSLDMFYHRQDAVQKAIRDKSQVRVSPLSMLRKRGTELSEGDPWLWSGAPTGPKQRMRPIAYNNEAEGYLRPGFDSGIEDIPEGAYSFEELMDPEQRFLRNLSLAVPKSHPLHRRSLILKRHGGAV